MTQEEFVTVQNHIDYAFKNPDLLHQAFTRKSYAEENGGYYSFSMTTLLDMTINSVGISPVRIFGITRDELEPMLRGLSAQYQDYINVAITLDLDNIVLSDYHTSGDILKLLEVRFHLILMLISEIIGCASLLDSI